MQVLIKPQKQAVFVIALVNWGVMSTTNVEGLNTAILDRKYAYERALRARARAFQEICDWPIRRLGSKVESYM